MADEQKQSPTGEVPGRTYSIFFSIAMALLGALCLWGFIVEDDAIRYLLLIGAIAGGTVASVGAHVLYLGAKQRGDA